MDEDRFYYMITMEEDTFYYMIATVGIIIIIIITALFCRRKINKISFSERIDVVLLRAKHLRNDERAAQAVKITVRLLNDCLSVLKEGTDEYFKAIETILMSLLTSLSGLKATEYQQSGLSTLVGLRRDLSEYIFFCQMRTLEEFVNKELPSRVDYTSMMTGLYFVREYIGQVLIRDWITVLNYPDDKNVETWMKSLSESFSKVLVYAEEDEDLEELCQDSFKEIYQTVTALRLDIVNQFLSCDWDKAENEKSAMNLLKKLKEQFLKERNFNTNRVLYGRVLLAELSGNDLRVFLQEICSLFKEIVVRPWWLDRCSVMSRVETKNNQKQRRSSNSKISVSYKASLIASMALIPNQMLNKYFLKELNKHEEMTRNKFYHARTYAYNALDDIWEYRADVISLSNASCTYGSGSTTSSCNRKDSIGVKIWEEDTIVTHRYQGEDHCLERYLSDVRRQSIATYYCYVFKKVVPINIALVQSCDRRHAQVFADSKCENIIEFFNYEAVDEAVKKEKIVLQKSSLAQTFTHFTYQASGGSLMVADLRGLKYTAWYLPSQCIMISDTTIHSIMDGSEDFYGRNNRGESGFRKFWTRQHKWCNPICKQLGLVRPCNYR